MPEAAEPEAVPEAVPAAVPVEPAALPLPVVAAGTFAKPPPAVAVASAEVPRELVKMKLLMHALRHWAKASLAAAVPSPWSQFATQSVVWLAWTEPG